MVCTANDVSKLPPEFSRSERFDGVFFLDLPSREEKDAIWKIYRDLYEVDPTQSIPDDTKWTGAEIKSCCRLAALLDLPLEQAAQNVVPVAVTASEAMDRLRAWASGRCLSASESGVYRQTNGSLNIGSNEQLDQLVSQARAAVNGIGPQELRTSEQLRQSVSTRMASVQAGLDQLLVDRPRRNIQRRPR